MRRLPLFPLPLVLFPGVILPLHIFEPRYRQMMAHCLEGDRRFGLVYHDADRLGAFRMDGQIGCMAELLRFQPLPDGRSLVLCRGEARFRIEDGIESDSMYYEALAGEYLDPDEMPPDLPARRRHSFDLLLRVLERIPEAPSFVPVDLSRETAFQIAQRFEIDPRWQQALLSLRGEDARLDRLDTLMRRLLAEPM